MPQTDAQVPSVSMWLLEIENTHVRALGIKCDYKSSLLAIFKILYIQSIQI